MDSYVCGRGFAIKESAIVGFSFRDGKVFILATRGELNHLEPYSVADLRQMIKYGKPYGGDSARLDCGISACAAPEQVAEFPALLFLVYGAKGNIKLCRARDFIFKIFTHESDDAFRARINVWVNNSPTIGNVLLSLRDSAQLPKATVFSE